MSLAVIEFLTQQRIVERVEQEGRFLLQVLQDLQRCYPDLILEVRGVGLLTALELVADSLVLPLSQACLEQGLLVTPTRNGVIRLIPDLLASRAHVQEALSILEGALAGLVPRVAAASQAGIDCDTDFSHRSE